MAQSLLAHLYTHIRGSQEDVATLSLQYIISQSDELRSGFNRLIGSKLHTNLTDVTKYTCQVSGENKERPDLSGKDKFGCEQVLCEAKFYAGLTDNQPLVYLDRLRNENGKGLIFICPEVRITSLWSKLCERCVEHTIQDVDKTCILVDGISMAIISWNEIITELHRIATASVHEALSDLKQLEGYCKELDMEAFIPFSSEELGAITARKQQRYQQVIVKTTELIHADKLYDTSRARLNSYNAGCYEYKLRIDKYYVYIAYDENLWSSNNSNETPFWLLIIDENGEQNAEIIKILQRLPERQIDSVYLNRYLYIALEPLTNATLDEVAENLKEQIYNYLAMFI